WATPTSTKSCGPSRSSGSRSSLFRLSAGRRRVRYREGERRPASEFGLHADPAAVPLHDLLADRQPDAVALILAPGVEALKDPEDALEVLRLDPDAVVLHREAPRLAFPHGGDVDLRGLGPAELDRIGDQVLEELKELRGIDGQRRERVVSHLGAALPDRDGQVVERPLQDPAGI